MSPFPVSPSFGYGFRNLTWHLHRAGRDSDILALVGSEDWLRFKLEYDGSRRGYADDVETAISAAQRLGTRGLADFVVYNLAFGLLGALTANVDPEVLALMVALGEGVQAEAYASLYVDPIRSAEAYSRMAAAYVARGEIETAVRLLAGARAASAGMPGSHERDRALALLGVALGAAGRTDEGAEVLDAVNDVELRERSLVDLADELFRQGLHQAGVALASRLSLPQHAI